MEEKPEASKINGEVALAVPQNEEKFLLVKRSKENSSSGQWAFPGGKIEEGETAYDAALRELEEETGLSGEIIRQGNSYIGEGELGYWRIYPVHVEASGTVELDHEHSEFKWLNLEELQRHDTMGDLKSLEKLDII